MKIEMGEQDKAIRSKVVYEILNFLDEERKNLNADDETKESLEIAMQCIETAFGIGRKDEKYKPEVSLMELMKNHEQKEEIDRLNLNVAAVDVESEESVKIEAPAPNPSSTSNVASSRVFDPLAGQQYVSTGPVYIRPPESSDEDQKLANIAKDKGNQAMKNSKVTEALEHYTKAIELDGNNATLFCNRAAAYIKLEDYDKAIRDCQVAIQLKPDYARAYGRMGVTYSTQGKHVDAILCYKKALELDPDTESYKNNLRVSQRIIQQNLPGAHAQAATSPNILSLLNNPNFVHVATNLLQNSDMQQMLSNFMTSIQSGGVGAAGMGQMEGLMQMGLAVAQQMNVNGLSEQMINLNQRNENVSDDNNNPIPAENSETRDCPNSAAVDSQSEESAQPTSISSAVLDSEAEQPKEA